MKKINNKKLCAAALSVLMMSGAAFAEIGTVAAASLPVCTASYETPASSFTYYISNGSVVITKYNGTDANVIIPSR